MQNSDIKTNFIKRRDALLSELSVNNISTIDSTGDEGDIANSNHEQVMFYVFKGRKIDKLKAISSVIERINDGTYGICEECGEKINAKRLQVMPFSRFCITCQEGIETKRGICGIQRTSY